VILADSRGRPTATTISARARDHPFDPEVFFAQLGAVGSKTLIVPGPIAAQLAEIHARLD
jgi:hypothetical protein